mgnify:CR=1 FL=1
MQLLASEEYGLRCLVELSRHAGPEPLTIQEIARAEGLSPAYNASKAGVLGLTAALNAQVATKGVRVNAILPGLVAGDRQRRVLEAKAQRLGKSFSETEAMAFSYTSIREYVTAEQIAAWLFVFGGIAQVVAAFRAEGWHEQFDLD